MFTGIIEQTGSVKAFKKKKNVYRLVVATEEAMDTTKIGDSIAINGACLTVVYKRGKDISFDIMPESIKNTSFAKLKKYHIVNIERALLVTSRLEGHFVQGHIDKTARIKDIKKNGCPYIDVGGTR